MRSARRVAPGAALLLLSLGGCASLLPWAPPRLPACEGPLPSTRELPPGDWLLRVQARITGETVDVGLELVVEKRGDRLVVVGFHALGTKAFSVVQRGVAVEAESHLGAALQVPPGNVLRDLHAAALARSGAPARVEVARPECGYTATFVRVARNAL